MHAGLDALFQGAIPAVIAFPTLMLFPRQAWPMPRPRPRCRPAAAAPSR